MTLVVAALTIIPASARADAAARLVLVLTDASSWETFAAETPGAYGLGVYPDSRDPLRFIEQIGTGAPTGGLDSHSPLRGSRGALSQAFLNAGINVAIDAGTAPAEMRVALLRAFGGVSRVGEPADFSVVYVPRGSSAVEQVGRLTTAGPSLVLGLSRQTPLWVAWCPHSCSDSRLGMLRGGISRRPGIVTPYDIAATILDHFDVESSVRLLENSGGHTLGAKPGNAALRTITFIGNPLTSQGDPNALDRIRRLRSHLERGATLGSTMGATTTLLAIGALVVGLWLRRRGQRRLSARAGQAAGIAVVGYLVALFVPSADGTVRALVITAVIVAGALLSFPDPSRSTGRLMLVAAALFAILVLIAPLRPGGLPGAAIWGNPLKSWRFTGMQNFEVSFLAVAVVVWAVLAGLKPLALGLVSFAATVIIGAPTVGSNFVGVLTIAFGASLAVMALADRRVKPWHVLISGGLAVAAFTVSLIADAASPVSHGGRAARRISEGGFSTLVDFVQARLRLNLDLIRSFKAGTGFLLMAMMLVVVALLLRWGAGTEAPRRGRAAAFAGAAMALSSLLLEDSGFYSGPIMLVGAAAAWMIVTATDEPEAVSSSDPASAGAG